MSGLTDKQKAFCDEYIISLNATEAAKKAGYSENTAEQIGWENLRKPKIQKYIKKRLDAKEEERIAKQDEVLEYLTRVMRAEEKEYYQKFVDGETINVEVDPSIKDRTKAAQLLGKRYAIFKDYIKHENDEVEINVNIKED